MSANSGAKQDSPPINWLKPEPIERVQVPVPSVPVDLLPKGFRDWLVDIAELMCAPLDYAAAIALIEAGFLLAGQVAVRPKRVDPTWLVITNVWGFIVGPPSMLKSPMIAAVQAPLEKIEKDLKAAYTNNLPKDLIKAQMRQLVRDITKEKDDVKKDELTKRYVALSEMPASTRPQLTVNDVTIPVLQEIQAKNPRGLFYQRDEIIAMLSVMEQAGHEGDMGYLLESFDGFKSHTVDRIGRGHLDIPGARLSLFGSATPKGINEYLRSKTNFGLMQRFQIVAASDLPPWVPTDRLPDTQAAKIATSIFEGLRNFTLDNMEESIRSQVDERYGVPYIHFDRVAQQIADDFRDRLERRLRDETSGEHEVMLTHLGKFRSFMPKLALLLYVIDCLSTNTPVIAIKEQSTLRAIKLCDHYEAHARKVYSSAIQPEETTWLLSRKVLDGSLRDGFTVRDIERKCWGGLTTREECEAALTALVDAYWLDDSAPDPTTIGKGRPPGRRYRINPQVIPLYSQKGRKSASGFKPYRVRRRPKNITPPVDKTSNQKPKPYLGR